MLPDTCFQSLWKIRKVPESLVLSNEARAGMLCAGRITEETT